MESSQTGSAPVQTLEPALRPAPVISGLPAMILRQDVAALA